jgi:hypothetical protein
MSDLRVRRVEKRQWGRKSVNVLKALRARSNLAMMLKQEALRRGGRDGSGISEGLPRVARNGLVRGTDPPNG